MKDRVKELLELLEPVWLANSDLNLLQMLAKLAKDSGYNGDLKDLTDDILIYHLKMLELGKNDVIPGIAKDYENDFKQAILKARGLIKE